jgi:hypothetical protein
MIFQENVAISKACCSVNFDKGEAQTYCMQGTNVN